MNDEKPEESADGRTETRLSGNQAEGQRKPEAESPSVIEVSAPEAAPASGEPMTVQPAEDTPPPLLRDSLRPTFSGPEEPGTAVSDGKKYLKIFAAAILVGFVAWLAPSPGWWSKASVVDAPAEGSSSLEARNQKSVQITLFFPDKNLANLVKERMTLNVPEETEGAIKAVLEELFNHSKVRNAIFPSGMEVLGVYLHEKSAIISIGGGFRKNYRVGAWTEILAVYSIVHTVCGNFESYKEVRLLINDIEEEMFASHVDISVPLAPDYSIVREEKKKVLPAQAPSKKLR